MLDEDDQEDLLLLHPIFRLPQQSTKASPLRGQSEWKLLSTTCGINLDPSRQSKTTSLLCEQREWKPLSTSKEDNKNHL